MFIRDVSACNVPYINIAFYPLSKCKCPDDASIAMCVSAAQILVSNVLLQ